MLQTIFSSTEPINNSGQREPVNNNQQGSIQNNEENPPNNDGQGSDRPIPTKLISQGTYGCVFRPGINCDGSQGEPNYITKLQTDKETVKNEISVGKIIQTIPNYEENFAPILETCAIDIKTIDRLNDEFEDCRAVSKDNDTTIEMNKIKFVGTNTLWTYLIVELKENPHKFVELMLETHVTLLDSLQKLASAGIIHNDIKENNIICRDDDGRPIIIDFGLSMEETYLKLPTSVNDTTRIHEYFFKYEPTYTVWAIDIALINYMMNMLNNKWLMSNISKSQIDDLLLHSPPEDRKIVSQYLSKYVNATWRTLLAELRKDNDDEWIELIYLKYGYQWRTEPITDMQILSVINDYMRNLPVLDANVVSSEMYNPELDTFKNKLITYFSKFYGQEWQVLFDELVKYSNSWDNYALSLIYLHLMEAVDLDDETNNNNKKMQEYQEILKSIILCCPNERPTAKETQTRLINALQTVTKPISEQLKKNIQTIPHDKVSQTIKKLQQHYSRSSFTS